MELELKSKWCGSGVLLFNHCTLLPLVFTLYIPCQGKPLILGIRGDFRWVPLLSWGSFFSSVKWGVGPQRPSLAPIFCVPVECTFFLRTFLICITHSPPIPSQLEVALQLEWCISYPLHSIGVLSKDCSGSDWGTSLRLALQNYQEFPHLSVTSAAFGEGQTWDLFLLCPLACQLASLFRSCVFSWMNVPKVHSSV